MNEARKKKIHERFFELMGGEDKASAAFWEEFNDQETRWDQDVLAIGRILRAHLYVEHYLAVYLQGNNLNLGPIGSAKLTFAQMAQLVDRRGDLYFVRIGIIHLNKFRNGLAHNLFRTLGKEQVAVFLQDPEFRRQCEDQFGDPQAPEYAIRVLELFAKYAARCLGNAVSPVSEQLRRAIAEIDALEEPRMEIGKLPAP